MALGEMATYTIKMDISRDNLYAHASSDVSSRFISAQWSYGIQDIATVEFAPPATLTLTLSNHDRAWFTTYASLVSKGMLIRIQATYSGVTTTLCVCKFVSATANANPGELREVMITCDDAMIRFLNAEVTPAITTDITTDAALQDIFDTGVLAYPYDGTYFILDASQLDTGKLLDSTTLTNFETGRTTIPYAGDADVTGMGISAQVYARDILAAEGGGRFYWDVKSQKFVFHNRYHDTVNYAVDATLTDTDIITVGPLMTDVVKNDVRVNYEPREAGVSTVTLFASDSIPFRLSANEVKVIQVRFRDPTYENARVGATEVTTPVIGSDIIANAQEDGGGANMSNVVSIGFTPSANSAELSIGNSGSTDVYITTLQVRGKKLTRYNQETAHAVDADSIFAQDRQPIQPYEAVLMGDAVFAGELAKQTVSRFKNLLMRIPAVTIQANQSSTLMNHAINRDIGDGVSLTLTHSNHTRSYVIIGMMHNVQASGIHLVTWFLKPTEYETAFILDSTEFGVLDTNVLGF